MRHNPTPEDTGVYAFARFVSLVWGLGGLGMMIWGIVVWWRGDYLFGFFNPGVVLGAMLFVPGACCAVAWFPGLVVGRPR